MRQLIKQPVDLAAVDVGGLVVHSSYMIKTKIVRTGNSAAVILPAAVLEAKGLKIGDDLEIEELASDLVLRTPGRRSVTRAIERSISAHGDVLKKLASR